MDLSSSIPFGRLVQVVDGLYYDGYGNLLNIAAAKPKYKVFTALLTQSDVYNNIGLFYGTTTIGVSYTIIEDGPLGTGYDFTVIGAPNNDIGTSFIATGTTPTWGTNGAVGLSYNVGAPVAIVLENTIGNVWFTYSEEGRYDCFSNNLFTLDKTILFSGAKTSGWDGLTSIDSVDYSINSFSLTTIINNVLSDGVLYNTPIEIRVYD
jgi:hypothetical protein